MKATLITRIDNDVKDRAVQMAKQIGIPLSLVVTASLKKFVADGQITLSVIPKATPYLDRLAKRAMVDYKKGVNFSPPLKTAEDVDHYFATL
jgi:antitoxin component of RelBE/YafQ-DinJ toxin-antitoxin module